jgi:hypothetical protein
VQGRRVVELVELAGRNGAVDLRHALVKGGSGLVAQITDAPKALQRKGAAARSIPVSGKSISVCMDVKHSRID